MKDEQDPQPTAEAPEPLDVMRKAYQDAEFHFEEDEGALTLRLGLKNLDVTVLCWGRAGDVASIIVRLPIRATDDFRARTGEFLHRLNYAAKRKFWEMDYSDGEIRLVAYTDTITGPLTEGLFRSIFHAVTSTADVTFPYLTSVLSGRMTPEFLRTKCSGCLPGYTLNFPYPLRSATARVLPPTRRRLPSMPSGTRAKKRMLRRKNLPPKTDVIWPNQFLIPNFEFS